MSEKEYAVSLEYNSQESRGNEDIVIQLAKKYGGELKIMPEKELEKLKSKGYSLSKEYLNEQKKKHFSLSEESYKKLSVSLKAEQLSFKKINTDIIKITNPEKDFLMATGIQGIENLDFIQNLYKNDGVKCISYKVMYEVKIPFENTLLEECYQNSKLRLVSIEKPIVLKIPKCIKKEITSPKDIQKIFQDIKGIVERFYIKNFSLDSIFYMEAKDKYIILELEDFVPLHKNVEIDLEQFLYNGNIYKYKGKPLSFEEHLFLIR